MPYKSTTRFVHQEVEPVPAGFHVRTVRAGSHQVRVAFPPGPRKKGSGIVVGVLHPRGENPCPVAQKNPSELLLMGANPMRGTKGTKGTKGIYDRLTRTERLAFGRLGLGKAQIQTESDVEKARRMVKETQRLRNRLPNPSAGEARLPSVESANAAAGRNLYEKFHARESERYVVVDEPHMPSGDYSEIGKLIALRVKPTPSGQSTHVQEISFPNKPILVVSDPDGKQIWFVGNGQHLDPEELSIFTSAEGGLVELGECRSIVYEAKKYHEQLAESARGESFEWEHAFGEEGGTCPTLSYDMRCSRLLLGRASYRVEGAGIVN
jgi:hypothetical protein